MADYFLMGAIYDEVYADFREFMSEIDKTEDLTIYINSPGGGVMNGFAMFDLLMQHEGKITTICEGSAASMASVILLAGEDRIAYENSEVMIHNPTVFTGGDADELEKHVERLRRMEERAINVYTSRTSMTEQQAKDYMNEETWFTASEAKDLGIITQVLNTDAEQKAKVAVMVASVKRNLQHRQGDGSMADGNNTEPGTQQQGTDPGQSQQTQQQQTQQQTQQQADPTAQNQGGEPQGTANQTTQQNGGVQSQPSQSSHGGSDPNAQNGQSQTQVDPQMQANIQAGIRAERQRVKEINELFDGFDNLAEMRDKCIDDGDSVEQASVKMIAGMREANNGTAANTRGSGTGNPDIQVGPSGKEEWIKDASAYMLARSSQSTDPEQRQKDRDTVRNSTFRGFNLMDLALSSQLLFHNYRGNGNREQVVKMAFEHGADDFLKLTSDVAYKSLLMGYNLTEETFDMVSREADLNDFKTHNLVGMSEFDGLEEITRFGEYTYGTIKDFDAVIRLGTFGRMFAINRHAVINDDTNLLTGTPMAMGRAARRKIADDFYALLLSNPTIKRDGKALFHNDHKNAGNSVPSIQAISDIKTAMATQKDENGVSIGSRPSIALCPVGLEDTFMKINSSDTDITQDNPGVVNVVRGKLRSIVGERRLDEASPTGWYLLGDPNMCDCMVVGYLNGEKEPFMDSEQGFDIDGMRYKVRIDFGVAVLDYKGIYRGAA